MYQAARPPMRRIMAIDQAMRAGEWPNATTLSRRLEVNARTIRRDIQFLRDQLRAPVEFDARHNGFYDSEPLYRLPHFQMSEGELLALYLAERLLRNLEGTPFESDLRGAIEKLGAMLPEGISVRLDERADRLAVLLSARPRYDAEAFRALTTAVVCRYRLEMVYWTASRDETTQRTFDPYDLALVEDGWYAVGYCHLRGEVRVFAVQRVRSVRPTGETFDRPADFRSGQRFPEPFPAPKGSARPKVPGTFSGPRGGTDLTTEPQRSQRRSSEAYLVSSL